MTVTRQLGLGFGKGRRVVITIPARPKLRMAKARLRRRQVRRS